MSGAEKPYNANSNKQDQKRNIDKFSPRFYFEFESLVT